MRPHPRQAVRLQLHSHGQSVLFARIVLRHLTHPSFNSDDFLHVMANLMRQHVSLRKLAGRAESLFQFVIESEVDIHLFVAWTVEWAGGRLRAAASRPG